MISENTAETLSIQPKDVIWIISATVAPNDCMLAALQPLMGRLPRPLVVGRAALEERPDDPFPIPLAADEQLQAVIIMLEKDHLMGEKYQYWLNWCIQELVSVRNIPLLACSLDYTYQQITNSHKFPDDTALLSVGKLLGTAVQVIDPPTPAVLAETLYRHLTSRSEVPFRANIRAELSILTGSLAGLLQPLVIIVAASLSLVSLLRAEANMLSSELTALLGGIALFPMLALLAARLFMSPGKVNVRVQLRESLATLIMPLIGLWLWRAEIQPGEFWLGMAFGLLVDLARRQANQAERTRFTAEIFVKPAPQTNDILAIDFQYARQLVGSLLQEKVNLLDSRLIAPVNPKVFISYGHTPGTWGNVLAPCLHTCLERHNIETFIDKVDIQGGTSWRKTLDDELAQASVIVVLLDQDSAGKGWVAAEVLTALRSRLICGAPEIVILQGNSITAWTTKFPVFDLILQNADALTDDIHHYVIDEGQIQADMAAPEVEAYLEAEIMPLLMPQLYHTRAAFPIEFTAPLKLATLPAFLLAAPGILIGFLAWLPAYLQYWNRFDSSGYFAEHGLLTTAFLLSAYWLGCVAQQAVTFGRTGFFLALIGLGALLLQWGEDVPALVIGWGIFWAWSGWLLASGVMKAALADQTGQVSVQRV